MSISRAISSYFFTDCGGGQFSCKQCSKVRKQSPGTGYTNLISHLATSHPGFRETYDESQRTHGQSLEAHGFLFYYHTNSSSFFMPILLPQPHGQKLIIHCL
ncbi:hypothetical protein JG688_00018147 [Phytophthora aleatoria]|uniref:BED-type domain-containing protein n=1 Tax=Phytophthora aleatoria TaxID=2496075 RepID=A0A8J5IRU1_9STRA|nr:hypothetical protein JG688_00018147 [Phytophthora aleatoria]